MATNFMKTALKAAVVAGLGASSFGAQAALQAVPGEAQLVPLVFHNVQSRNYTPAAWDTWDTAIRIEVPNSLGKDTVIQITAANSTPTSKPAVESIGQPATKDGIVKLHWYFLDMSSNHVIDGTVGLTLDDEGLWLASNYIPGNTTGYVVIVNDSAVNGGPATDAFFADAFLVNDGAGDAGEVDALPATVSIPTYAMDDGVDTTTYPTPFNNVIESQQFTTAPKFPVASPIHSGIRTGASAFQGNIRLFDLALADRGLFDNILVVWNDRNGMTQQAVEFNDDEQSCSTTISLPQQLNIVYVPAGYPGANSNSYFRYRHNNTLSGSSTGIAFVDSYKTSGANKDYTPVNFLCQTYASSGRHGLDSGFLKIYANEVPQKEAPTVNNGAYAAAAAFTIPVFNPPRTGTPGGQFSGTTLTINTVLAKDRGFFDAK